jgi:spore coat polysaccharide biosynthesis protein SpsF
MPELGSVLEPGASIGINLRALRRLVDVEMWAVEPNDRARRRLVDDRVVPTDRALSGDLSALPVDDAAVDLVFTRGVLIHVPDEHLETAYREMHRVARRWLMFSEYFAPATATVRYHGHDDMLWKRDYGALALDLFDDVRYVADGFFWHRVTGLDNVNWWLFEKV